MDEIDEDDGPQFPWPMWIPVLSWLAHGIALVGVACHVAISSSKPYENKNYWLAVFALAVGSIFLTAGCSTLRGRPRGFAPAVCVSFLYFLAGGAYLLSKGPLTGDRPYFLMDAVALFITAIIALAFHSKLIRWCISRRNQPGAPS